MKKISVFTAARSEYGPLKPLIYELMKSDFIFELVVSGGHLDQSQGYTITEILADQIPVSREINSTIEEKGALGINLSNAKLLTGFAEYLNESSPDLVIVLGDRSELIPVTSACLFASVPIAHISGGEVTEGATDNQVRHAVSKMSHIHFTATQTYKENLMKMGEEEWRICVSGEPGLDDVLSTLLPTREAFFDNYSIPIDSKLIISTFHSETIHQTINRAFLNDLIIQLSSRKDCFFLFTGANLDIGGEEINETLTFLSNKYDNIGFVQSLGKVNYYAAQKYGSAMLGNSSSGIIEAMSFNLPVINVGDRQSGRLRNINCIDVSVNSKSIIASLEKALSEDFKKSLFNSSNIYGDGTSSKRILKFIESLNWNNLLHKKSVF
jgi:GDP/UDP-N,N'-diacetylbacillosamine 2-epimerase (hydrolysing)